MFRRWLPPSPFASAFGFLYSLGIFYTLPATVSFPLGFHWVQSLFQVVSSRPVTNCQNNPRTATRTETKRRKWNREHKKSRRSGGSILKTNHDVPQLFTLPLYVPLPITLVFHETESLSLSSEATQHGSTQHDSGPAGFWQNNRHVACVCE